MKVTYIEHSGFLLETQDACFLFDYYKGKIPEIKREKALVVFVSHKHSDHYNADIFDLVIKYPDAKFVLSKDVRPKWKIAEYKEKGIRLESHILEAPRNVKLELTLSNGKPLAIETLQSTDEGVAFILDYEGSTFYHAGDLNLWIWEGESKQYNNNMKASYLKELEKLKGRKIDIAFVPLDPRLETNAMEGLKTFMECTKCNHVFPMHFWGKYSIIPEFLEQYREYEGRIEKIEKAGQEFIL